VQLPLNLIGLHQHIGQRCKMFRELVDAVGLFGGMRRNLGLRAQKIFQ
jgi:hypothetical protein